MIPGNCCGQHGTCERESPRAARREADYYDDEELDRFCGTAAEDYTEEAAGEFREILYTMREEEVAGWVHSLGRRGIALPDALKDEVFLMIGEKRI
jgi:hypothetical protein